MNVILIIIIVIVGYALSVFLAYHLNRLSYKSDIGYVPYKAGWFIPVLNVIVYLIVRIITILPTNDEIEEKWDKKKKL